MKSHEYSFTLAELGRLFASILIPVTLIAAGLRAGAVSGLLPRPWPALDVDRTILTHQAKATQSPNPADVLFIGDSSCLMDIRGKALEDISGGTHRAQNLGSFMYLGMQGYAAMLRKYFDTNPGRVQTVVVLVHPQMLRGGDPAAEYLLFLSDLYAGTDHVADHSIRGQASAVLGLHILEGRILGRSPLPLPGVYADYYGFNLNLANYMDDQRGSATDPHVYKPAPGQGSAEYRLGASFEPGCLALRAAVPPGVKVAIGLAPVPASFAPSEYQAKWQRLQADWEKWMQSDTTLTNLPAVMPDDAFASTTHLNGAGADRYTMLLLQSLGFEQTRPAGLP